LRRAFKLRGKLGAAGGIGDYIPKPKWMRWPTYDRKLEEVAVAEEVVDAHLCAFAGKLNRRFGALNLASSSRAVRSCGASDVRRMVVPLNAIKVPRGVKSRSHTVLPDATVMQDAICAIAGQGVRNASSISTPTPSPVITSLVSRFMIKILNRKK
jgi:hypothetical protein